MDQLSRNGRILLGDFNARYGQGLALWTSLRIGGLQTPEAFMLRGSGIAPSWSATGDGTLRGIVLDWTPGALQCTAFAALGGNYGLRGGYLWRNGELGCTAFRGPDDWRLSLEGRWHYRRTTWFSEASWRKRDGEKGMGAGLAGCRTGVGERSHLVFLGRALPSRFSGKKNGEYACAAGYARPNASLTVETALLPIPGQESRRWQIKSYALWDCPFDGGWTLRLRAYERWRSYERNRLDLRGDLSWEKGPWTLNGRINALFCQKSGRLGFLEGGYKDEIWTLWLRTVLFHIDAWDDRIYVYEHDAPGNFTVPACHGRGGTASVYGAWKYRLRRKEKTAGTLKCYFRAYGMFRKDRTPGFALRMQMQMEW